MNWGVVIVATFGLLCFVGLATMILDWPYHVVSDRAGSCGAIVFLVGGIGVIVTGLTFFFA